MINEKIVNKLAKRFINKGIAFEDLKAEAYKHASAAVAHHDEASGADINTLQWVYINRGLSEYCKKEWTWQNSQFNSNVATTNCQMRNRSFLQSNEIDDNDRDFVDTLYSEEQSTSAFEIIESMSKEAKMACQAIFSAPGEYMSLMPKMARGRLAENLRNDGWSWPQIWRVFNEIKSALN